MGNKADRKKGRITTIGGIGVNGRMREEKGREESVVAKRKGRKGRERARWRKLKRGKGRKLVNIKK